MKAAQAGNDIVRFDLEDLEGVALVFKQRREFALEILRECRLRILVRDEEHVHIEPPSTLRYAILAEPGCVVKRRAALPRGSAARPGLGRLH